MKVKVGILSPIHIGSGEEISPTEYFVDGAFVRLDMNGLFGDPDFQALMDKFITSASSQRYVGDLLPKGLLRAHPLYSLPLQTAASQYLETNKTTVKEFIKSAGRVFLPGSSIKGSILSALLWYVLREAAKTQKAKIEALITSFDRRAYSELLDYAFSLIAPEAKDNKRFAPWIAVSDSNPVPPQDCLEISLARVEGSQSSRQLPILYETLRPSQDTAFQLDVTTQKSRFSLSETFDICGQFYKKVLSKDEDSSIATSNYLLRLGQGSTAFSTSFLILAEDLSIRNYRVRSPRTRKRIAGVHSMGWVELST